MNLMEIICFGIFVALLYSVVLVFSKESEHNQVTKQDDYDTRNLQ